MLEGNPYEVLVKKCRKRFKADAVGTVPLETVNLKTGEVRSAVQLVGTQKVYDITDFIKLYEPEVFVRLGSQGVAVFSYIMSRLQFGGFVQIDMKDCLTFTGYTTRKSIYRGLDELKEKDIIRPKCEGEYWVNPNIVYRGQRDEFMVS